MMSSLICWVYSTRNAKNPSATVQYMYYICIMLKTISKTIFVLSTDFLSLMFLIYRRQT